ncbi:histidine phosphatase family protein [Rhodobacter capsulatus]|uniref:histidine phosphatase family protein n=1 Tax=Rhodobacter capsulatus TaxID=1061 RepID=UPI0003D2D3A9|nr:histidine phosphatase family protein [Rhodobacter capsulatus]ETD81925.1 phosphoglycerate mutase [Rhodobacter capsulatus YW1]
MQATGQADVTTELWLIRHAPARHEGRLAGRRDVPCDLPGEGVLASLRAAVGMASLVCSPAARCQQTAAALWPGVEPRLDARLWEQDFGAWENRPFAELPDIGLMPLAEVATHRPPGGESYAEQCARVAPVLRELAGQGGRIAVVAHAGVVRAALSLALGSVPAGLAFQVAPLSVTRLVAVPGGLWSIAGVNRVFG